MDNSGIAIDITERIYQMIKTTNMKKLETKENHYFCVSLTKI